ncbi:hypothetical protein BJ912DRAFT_196465 [Pholiota molesta]|nr:hypothetical protein BJ912DRAFT_196465 [Pholiota molesta]
MYKTLQITSRLLYIVQLHFDGLKDAGTSTAHYELIERLQRHREAWSSLNMIGKREYVAIVMKYQFHAYELVGGAFADTDSQYFQIVSLPTSRNEERCKPRETEPGMLIRDFKMDPTQDVIVFLEDSLNQLSPPTAPRIFRIHIRAISTNTIHPLAQQSSLQISVPFKGDRFYDHVHNVVLNLAREIVVLYFCTFDQAQPYIQIWDWMTSDVLFDCFLRFDQSISRSLEYQFGLLDSTYCFITDTFGSGSIRLYKLVRSPSAAHAPVHLATLYLPPVADDVRVPWIFADTTPIAANPLPHVPFLLNDDDRLHVFMPEYVYQPGASMGLTMFVHQRVFTRYCTRRAEDGDMPLEIPWEEWGPMHTRLIYNGRMLVQNQLRYIHGQRVVWTRPSTDAIELNPESPPNTMEVLDFSLAAVFSAKNDVPLSPLLEKGKRGTLVASSTIHAAVSSMIHAEQPPLLKHDVVTHLPCVSTELILKQAYSMYMIYEHGIVGVDVCFQFSSSALASWYDRIGRQARWGRTIRGVSMLFH